MNFFLVIGLYDMPGFPNSQRYSFTREYKQKTIIYMQEFKIHISYHIILQLTKFDDEF